MATELTLPRRQMLARGLLRLCAVALLIRAAAVAIHIHLNHGDIIPLILLSHFGVAAIITTLSFLLGRQRWLAVLATIAATACYTALQLPQHHSIQFGPIANLLWFLQQLTLFGLLLLATGLVAIRPDGKLANWQKAHPRTIKVTRLASIGIISIFIIEATLRQLGWKPGYLRQPFWLKEVDQLVSLPAFGIDSSGIYCLQPELRNCMEAAIEQGSTPPQGCDHLLTQGLERVATEYHQIAQGTWQGEYTLFLDSLRNLPPDQRDPIDAAYLHQVTHPINPQGFRSIPFESHQSRKRRILLIGDSFTWGHSASHIGMAFPELLMTKGWGVYNAGISATDPAQYEAIARRYLPQVKPDVVIVNLYLGNDILNFERPVSPNHPPFYPTNAGILNAYPGPEWLPTPESAYRFALEECRIPGADSLWIAKLASKTVLGTQLWRLLRATGILPNSPPNQAYWERCAPNTSQATATGSHLRRIQALCQANGATFRLAIIPTQPSDTATFTTDHPELIQGLQPHFPTDLTPEDYHPIDGHFIDTGHQKYARFLHHLL